MFGALEGTQLVGTLVAVYGFLVTPIGWANAGIVWGYAILWILLLDAAKVLTYRILDQVRGRDAPKSGAEDRNDGGLRERLMTIEHTVEENRELLEESRELLEELAGRG